MIKTKWPIKIGLGNQREKRESVTVKQNFIIQFLPDCNQSHIQQHLDLHVPDFIENNLMYSFQKKAHVCWCYLYLECVSVTSEWAKI